MSFGEYLKGELDYSGMLVKELSAITGIPKKTLDNYLLTNNNNMPAADKAVAIAQALGVSVEYLVTGKKSCTEKAVQNYVSPEVRIIADIVEPLGREERKIVAEAVAELAALLQKQDEPEDTLNKALTPLQKVFLRLFRG
ncbi:MAG: helix-turn-helix domain-containing protein [Treponema sp.]|jgi:transcriptional regulator with XRE-family HTH domain|nr:helix-turn-helix domain-containing protein [Treponema sp.]